MARKASVYWVESTKAWRSNVGDYSPKTGRRQPVYFREIPNTPRGRRQAEQALEDYLRERDRREEAAIQDASNPAVWDGVVKPYLESVRERVDEDKGSPETLRSHADRLERFLRFVPTKGPFAGIPIAERLARSLTDDDAAMLVEWLASEDCGPQRITGIFQSIHACFNWAARSVPGRQPKQILTANPFAGFWPDRPPKRHQRLPTRAEVAAFFRAAREQVEAWKPIPGRRCGGCVRAKREVEYPCRRSHAKRTIYDRAVLVLCRLQVYSGTRPGELCKATWDEVRMPGAKEGLPGWEPRAWQDPNTGHWWGRLVIFGKTSRAKGELRKIAVPPALVRAIERIRRQGLNDRLIFPRRGQRGSGEWNSGTLSGKVRPWRNAAGLGSWFVLYALRHRFYTTAVHEANLSAEVAGKVGDTGAETIRSTYLHADDRAIFEAAERITRAGRKR